MKKNIYGGGTVEGEGSGNATIKIDLIWNYRYATEPMFTFDFNRQSGVVKEHYLKDIDNIGRLTVEIPAVDFDLLTSTHEDDLENLALSLWKYEMGRTRKSQYYNFIKDLRSLNNG